jgi:hypothetical protein
MLRLRLLHKLSVDPYNMNKTLFTAEEFEVISKPSVLISGGGIGDLTRHSSYTRPAFRSSS